jgi:hypothetical protein
MQRTRHWDTEHGCAPGKFSDWKSVQTTVQVSLGPDFPVVFRAESTIAERIERWMTTVEWEVSSVPVRSG